MLLLWWPRLNPGWGTKILQAVWCDKKKEKRKGKKNRWRTSKIDWKSEMKLHSFVWSIWPPSILSNWSWWLVVGGGGEVYNLGLSGVQTPRVRCKLIGKPPGVSCPLSLLGSWQPHLWLGTNPAPFLLTHISLVVIGCSRSITKVNQELLQTASSSSVANGEQLLNKAAYLKLMQSFLFK